MRKAVTVITVLVIGLGAYLGWDWYDKTHKQQLEPSITLYYWTDSKGGKHISDSPPPAKARNVYTDKGYKHIRKPIVVMVKDRAVDIYKKIKRKLFKPRKASKE